MREHSGVVFGHTLMDKVRVKNIKTVFSESSALFCKILEFFELSLKKR